MKKITVIEADITTLAVDAIVNSAKTSLTGGSGVDRAIHRAAGPELLEECWDLAPCFPGSCVVTKPYRLACGIIIHTVAPHWRGGTANEVDVLKSCYQSALDIAQERDLKSIAFPCIGVGAFCIPHVLAAQTAINAVQNHPFVGEVIFCCFLPLDKAIYDAILEKGSAVAAS